MQIDWHDLLLAARECEASYLDTDEAARVAFQALGCTYIDRLETDVAQAVIMIAPDGVLDCVITGTRFSEGTAWETIRDLGQDADFIPVPVEGGGHVPAGALVRTKAIWAWLRPLLGPGQRFRVRGHSLAAQCGAAVLLVFPNGQIVSITSIEPPKGGTAPFWIAHSDMLPLMTVVVHGGDPFFAWPPLAFGLRHPPIPTLWLKTVPGQWAVLDRPDSWPGPTEDFSDHDISIIAAAIEAIVTALGETAQ